MLPEKKPFTSDGCTLWPDGPWGGCCVAHDYAYWKGGTAKMRKQADKDLRDCVAARGYPVIGWVMYVGVRLFGSVYWPVPWRWGYGWRYKHAHTYRQQVQLRWNARRRRHGK